jgi:hypothetical protein
MTSLITTISLTSEEKELIQRFNLSPSALIKEKIREYQLISESSVRIKEEYERKIANLRATIDKQRDFIEAEGLMDAFLGLGNGDI